MTRRNSTTWRRFPTPRPFHGMAGFSLLEIILVMALLGIVGLMGSMGFVRFSRGFILAKEGQATAAKGQLAMMRLAKEFQTIKNASIATSTRLAYTATRTGGDENHEIRLAGSELLLDNQTLVNRVNGFTLNYYSTYNGGPSAWSATTRLIEITLTLGSAQGASTILQTRVATRNN